MHAPLSTTVNRHVHARWVGAIAVGVAILTSSVACGQDQAEVPNVIDTKLDEAKDRIKDAGFEEPKEDDALGDRSPMKDSNWVVIAQDPAPGQSVDTNTEITVTIAKPDDDKFLDVAPTDSTYAQQVRQQHADEAAQQQAAATNKQAEDAEKAAKQAQETKDFVNDLDPSYRLGKEIIDRLAIFVQTVEDGTVSQTDFALVPQSAVDGLTTYKDLLDTKSNPGHLEDPTDKLKASVEGFIRAARTLSSLNGTSDAATLQRFHDVYNENRALYNTSITAIYNGTGIQPPLIS